MRTRDAQPPVHINPAIDTERPKYDPVPGYLREDEETRLFAGRYALRMPRKRRRREDRDGAAVNPLLVLQLRHIDIRTYYQIRIAIKTYSVP